MKRIGGDEVIWTFEPDVVYSALEFLMARVSAEHPDHSSTFGTAVRSSMPKATSLQLTVSVTTKLAHLLQEQAGREVAWDHFSCQRSRLPRPVVGGEISRHGARGAERQARRLTCAERHERVSRGVSASRCVFGHRRGLCEVFECP